MCKICRKYKCPPSCPSYDGESAERGKRVGECALCGTTLCEYDYIEYTYGKPYCYECIDMRFDEIVKKSKVNR